MFFIFHKVWLNRIIKQKALFELMNNRRYTLLVCKNVLSRIVKVFVFFIG